MAFFRYSKIRNSRGHTAIAAVVSQTLVIAFLALTFRSISTYSGASTHAVSEFLTAIIGFETGFFYAVFAWPLSVRRAVLVSVAAVASAAVYWAASPEPQDRWLAEIIAGAGVGLLTAVSISMAVLHVSCFSKGAIIVRFSGGEPTVPCWAGNAPIGPDR